MSKVEKKLKTRLYNFRINEDEYKMIQFIKNKTNIDLPSSLRKLIGEMYNEAIRISDIDDEVYRL